MRSLFVSWDGPGPNYHEALFLPIFARCRRGEDEIHLFQYAWDAAERSSSVRAAAKRVGMPYTTRRVWRTPQAPATAAMIVKGGFDLVSYARRHHIDVLMPRSIIPAGMALLALRVLPNLKLVFDADGLMADERADFGGWSREGKPYRALRAIETAAVRRADVVMVRTCRAKQILSVRAGLDQADKVVIVSNGKDACIFTPGTNAERIALRRELGLADEAPLIVYAGSLGPHYHPDRVTFFAARVQAARPDAHLLCLTGTPEVALAAARAQGLAGGSYTVRAVPPEQVPHYLAAADLGLAFRTPSLSQLAVAPIKVGEYLLCGVPVLGSGGIGDLNEQLDSTTARLLDSLDDAALDAAAEWFVEEVLPARELYRSACRARGMEHFSLQGSVARYREAFNRLAVP